MCRLLSCTIRADGISVNGGIHRHRPVRVHCVPAAGKHHPGGLVQPVPLLVVGEPALHWLPISVIAPLAAVILLPAVCGLRVNDDLPNRRQDGGDFGAGRFPAGQSGCLPYDPGCPLAAWTPDASFAQEEMGLRCPQRSQPLGSGADHGPVLQHNLP